MAEDSPDYSIAPAERDGTPKSGGAAVQLVDIHKAYGDFVAVDGICLEIGAGEFLTLLGPSGSGKSTTLMIIAGFVVPNRGDVLIDRRHVTRLTPQKRGLGVVFQNYALFPHMSVYHNVAFPLEMRGVSARQAEPAVEAALRIVQLEGLGHRMPSELSGGQQQRVALARAIVFQPRVLLMDEPLGALDKKLRTSLQVELKHIQRQLGVTVIYVTHDQEEALTMSDRIAIMRNGRIEQIGTPEQIYDEPSTSFIADFIGESNFLDGMVLSVEDGHAVIEHASGEKFRATSGMAIVGRPARASIRPERLALGGAGPGDSSLNCWPGLVREIVYVGDALRYYVEVGGERAQSVVVKLPHAGLENRYATGDRVSVLWRPADTKLLDFHDG